LTDKDKKDKLLAKSKLGLMYGEVTAVAIRKDYGEIGVALSSNGEIMTFRIHDAISFDIKEKEN